MWRYLSNVEPPRKKPSLAKISRHNDSNSMISNLARENFSRRGRKTTRVGNGSGWCLTIEWSLCFAVCAGLLQRLIKTKRGRLLSALINSNLRTSKRTNCRSRTFIFKTCFDNQNKPVADTQAGVCVQQLTSAQREKVTKLMRNLWASEFFCGRVEI